MTRQATLLAAALLAAPSYALDVSGKVVADHDGAPVAGARVRILRAGDGLAAAERATDGNGGFRAPGLADDRYLLEVSKPGYLTSRGWAGEGGAATVRLFALGAIAGRVVDGGGRPVAAARVCARREADPIVPCRAGAATTGRDGTFAITGLAPGDYSVFAVRTAAHGRAPGGFAAHPRPVAVARGSVAARIELTLPATSPYAVSGRLDGAGDGEQYVVALVPGDRPHIAVAVGYATDGRFRLEGVAPGSYRLFASGPVRGRSSAGALVAPGGRYGQQSVDVLAQDVGDANVVLREGVDAVVRLEHDAGPCPESASVVLEPLADVGATMPVSVTASRSGGLVRGLPPGRYALSAPGLGGGCFAERESVEIDADRREATLRLSPTGAVHGRVVRGGAPVAGMEVTLAPVSAAGDERTALAVSVRSDAAGRFGFADLIPGIYRLVLTTDTGFEVEAIGGSVTEIELPVRDE